MKVWGCQNKLSVQKMIIVKQGGSWTLVLEWLNCAKAETNLRGHQHAGAKQPHSDPENSDTWARPSPWSTAPWPLWRQSLQQPLLYICLCLPSGSCLDNRIIWSSAVVFGLSGNEIQYPGLEKAKEGTCRKIKRAQGFSSMSESNVSWKTGRRSHPIKIYLRSGEVTAICVAVRKQADSCLPLHHQFSTFSSRGTH